MKKKFLSILIVLLMVITMAAPSIRLYAAPDDEGQEAGDELTEAFFEDIKEGDIFLVYVEWEKSQPIVKFRSPSGVIYDTSEAKEGTTLTMGEDGYFYQIADPEPGEWYVLFNKKDNESISIDLQEVSAPFVVTDVKVGDITGSDAKVSFKVNYRDYIGFNYKISVSVDGSKGEVVYEGSAYTNEEVEQTIDMSRFGSSDHYRVYVYASYGKDGGQVGEGAFSDRFTFNNSNIYDMQTPVSVTVSPDDFSVKVTLDKSYRYSYLLAYFIDDSTEPAFFMEVPEDGEKSIDYVYDVNAKSVRVEVSEKRSNGAYSLPKKYTVNLAKLPKITFDSVELTNKRFIAYGYSGFTPKTTITIAVNDVKGEYILNAAEGSMTAALNNTYNEVTVSFTDSQDVTVLYKTEIYMDIEAPRIYMLQDYTNVKTSGKSYNVLGTVTGADSFTIGGKEVALNNDGTFAFSLELKKGENEFLAEARDMAGNVSYYTITIHSADLAPTPTPQAPGEGGSSTGNTGNGPKAGLLSFLPAIIAGILGIALIVLVLVLGHKQKASTVLGDVRKIVIFLGALGLIFTGFSTYNFVKTNLFVNSTEFIDMAYHSIDEAGAYLQQLAFWKKLTIAGAVELGVCVVGIVVLTLINMTKKKKADN